MCLQANLDQPNHRHQHSQIPQPADHQVGAFSPPNKNSAGNDRQKNQRQKTFPNGQAVLGKGIQKRQLRRIKHLFQINSVRHQGIGNSQRKWHLLTCHNGFMLRQQRHPAPDRGQRKHWNFFKQELPWNKKTFWLVHGFCETAQRPVVQ